MAYLGSMMWLTDDEAEQYVPGYADELTITPRKGFEGAEDPLPIEQWVKGRGKVGLPVDYGVQKLSALEVDFEERLAKGTKLKCKKRPDPNHPAAPEGQAQFFADIISEMGENYGVVAQAGTGTGKTTAALNAVAEFQRSTIVIVPKTTLMYQWRDEAKRHLGLTDDQIGLIGDGHEQIDRPFTICVIHNLFQRIFPQEFYEQFGMLVYDELHNLGAREFYRTTRLFACVYRLGMSATPDRKDGCEDLFFNYLGPIRVRATHKPLPLEYHVRPFQLKGIPGSLNYCQSTAKPLMWLSEHEGRNDFIVSIIQELFVEAFSKQEAVLVVTKFVEHAELLMRKCASQGANRILPMQMGLYIGQKTGEDGKRKQVKQEELDEVAERAKVIFATYGKMGEGVDIPRIGFGVEAMPVSDVRQAVGRARRRYGNRTKAKWVSIRDTGIRAGHKMCFLYNFAAARIGGLKEVGGLTIING